MLKHSWILEDYYAEQYLENPQLFETNVTEWFDNLETFKVNEVISDTDRKYLITVYLR